VRIKRRREVIVETAEVLVLRRGSRATLQCPQCGGRVRMMTLEETVVLTGASSREIHRRVEAGEIHFAETAEGLLLVCLNSLTAIHDPED
jgi:hypothetical protein